MTTSLWRVLTDGLGYVAFVDLAPGKYKVFVVDDARVTGKRVQLVYASAGTVARFAITPFAKGNEGRGPAKETSQRSIGWRSNCCLTASADDQARTLTFPLVVDEIA